MTVQTERIVTSTGATSYTFPFEYLKTTDIKITVDGTATTEFTVPSGSPTTVQFNTGHVPASGKSIRIYRDTNVDNLSATFYAGSAIKSQDLNDNFNQNLYVTQEAKRDAASAWQDGDETIHSTETWHTSDETKVATTKAIESRIDTKIDTALTTDVSGGDGVTIVDNSPGSGQIRVDLDADIATLKDMQSGAATQLAALTSTELAILDGATVSTAEVNLLDGVTATTAELNILDGVTATKDEINLLDGVTSTTAELNILDGVTATKDEINILDGVTSTTAELNILDGVTATKDEINILDGVTATAAELNILDGVTSTAAELNILDGVTATAAELNKLDGVTASTTELNKVDGLTASTAELNILDGVTATTAELNKTDGLTATPVELNTLDGVTANTSELNKLDGVTASTAELNIVDGKSFKTSSGTLDTTSDTEIPSSKVIAAHVASSQTAIGGFITIADEVSFPNTQPANGVVVSINNAAGLVVNGSGVSTSAKRVDNTTVTINGFPSSLNSETLAAGVGLVVTSTSTANTYAYHKLLAAETDVKQLSDDINDFNARYRVASSAPGSSNDAGDMYFDTSANKMKVYNGTTSAWDDVASVGSFYVNTISSSSGTGGGSATFNGSAYRFTLSNAGTSAQQHIVSVNGVIQKPNTGSSQPSEGFALSGNDIIFAAAPASGSDSFIITCGSSVSIGTPSANSVNSSHIIDGSIVDGDISSSAAIGISKLEGTTANRLLGIDGSGSAQIKEVQATGDQIADEAITEGKLDVHNAPATNKYLKYTSNGMEWSDGASEGTDVKSTGESGTTKFLRVDGDGTSSWQIPPDTVYTHPNHSGEVTSSADGAQTIASNVVDEDNLKVSNTPTNGQFLSAQSGNTGGLTWATVEAAPTIEGVAEGTIAANKPCIVKSNGKIDQVEEAITTQTPAVPDHDTLGTAGQNANNESPNPGASFAHDEDNDCYMVVWNQNNSTSNVKFRFGYRATAGDENITWTSITDTGYDGYVPAVCYDRNAERWVVSYQAKTGYSNYVKTYKYADANKNSLSSSGSDASNNGPINGPQLFYHNGLQKTLLIGQNDNNAKTIINFVHIVGDTVDVGDGTSNGRNNLVIGSGTTEYTNLAHAQVFEDPNRSNKIYITTVGAQFSGSNQNKFELHTLTVTGTPATTNNAACLTRTSRDTILAGSSSSSTRMSGYYDLTWDVSASKAVVVYTLGDNYGKAILVSTTDSGGSASSPSSLDSSNNNINAIHIEYDKTAQQTIYFWRDGGVNNRMHAAALTASGSSISKGTTSSPITAGSMSTLGEGKTTVYVPSLKMVAVASYDGSTSNVRIWHLKSAAAVTNLTAGNFVGFSSAGYSDGNTAKIHVVGNTTTQSSLTAGSKYYVQGDGTIGTSASIPSVEAGLALSSTKLLIK